MKIVRTALSFLLLAALTSIAGAEDWPTRRLRVVVPFPAGGSGDVQVRVVADELAKALGQPVIVENKPGGSGGIAAVDVAHAPPDGYTLMVGSVGTHAINVSLYSKLQYDPVKDFAPLTLAVSSPSMLVVHPSVPVRSVKELIALAKARPGQLNYAAGTIGATPHLAAELFKVMAGVNIVRVPYKGSGPSLIGLMSGEVEFMFPGAASAWGFVKQGRLRALGICALHPSALFPGVPTVSASGVPGYESVSPQGVVAPARTPVAIVTRLNQEFVRALNRPEVKERLNSSGIEIVGSSPEEYAASMRSDIARTSKLIKDANIRKE